MQIKCANPSCNKVFEIKKRGNPRKWCSLRCRSLFLQKGYEERYSCENCGKKFKRTVTPKLIESNLLKRHCSKRCVNATFSKQKYNPTKGVTKICARLYCNNSFNTFKTKSRFCSDRCRENRPLKIYKRNCIYCKKNFETTLPIKKYCSQVCRTKSLIKPVVESICENPNCYTKILTNGSRKYCCVKCRWNAQYWRELGTTKVHQTLGRQKNYIKNFSWQRRHLFFDLKNNQCETCGSADNLQIHHKKYTTNHDDWQLLCIFCHQRKHNS